jgi:hypothetical protein
MDGTCSTHGQMRYAVGKSEGKRPLGRPVRRWGDNIKADTKR